MNICFTGNSQLRQSADDLVLLQELREFSKPFNRFIESVSGGTTNAHALLSLITLIKANITQRMSKIIANKKSHTSNEAIIFV